MKVKMSHVQPRESASAADQQVRAEIQSFLEALDSYPALFARNPDITFDQYLSALVSESKTKLAAGTNFSPH
jgi:hypothetical protein